MDPSFLPAGSDKVRAWAYNRGIGYEPRPKTQWFRGWEPFDMVTSPAGYYNACSWQENPGGATIVEPWTEDGLFEPMDRTLFGFARHPRITGHASVKAGEFFITRVAFLTDPPPPVVELGDPKWDPHVEVRAKTPEEARRVLPQTLRDLLRRWGYQGHLEVRDGGLLIHFADLKPTDVGYDAMTKRLPLVVNAALGGA